jgi:hypothetical protein
MNRRVCGISIFLWLLMAGRFRTLYWSHFVGKINPSSAAVEHQSLRQHRYGSDEVGTLPIKNAFMDAAFV